MPLASSAALVTANKFIDLCLFCTGAHKCPVAVDQACTWKLYTKTVGTHLVLARSQTEVKRRCGEAPLN